jgi:cysteine desulfurase
MKKEPIYFDNNATTGQCQKSIDESYKWMKVCANPSSTNKSSLSAKKLIDDSKKYILKHCGTNSSKYTIIFTSGGSESNSFIIRSTTTAYYKLKNTKPHIIISSIEHNSIIDCCEKLVENDCIELTKIVPDIYGIINVDEIIKKIKSNTCLISIMFSNNEIGSINNIKQIGKIAHQNNIPLHTDAVQIFGKYQINLPKNNIDAISVSFHKLYSPKGIGMVIINNEFINGYGLESIISGSQQNGLRGGTENVSSIAGAIMGMKCNFHNRDKKNEQLRKYRNYILETLNNYINIVYYDTYMENYEKYKNIEFLVIMFGPHKKNVDQYVENTLLLSIVSNKKKICNSIIKKDLEKNGVIVSIGSACSTHSSNASHVLTELGAPMVIKRGTIRISLGDSNTFVEVKKFIPILIKCINIQVPIVNYIQQNKYKNIKDIIKKI